MGPETPLVFKNKIYTKSFRRGLVCRSGCRVSTGILHLRRIRGGVWINTESLFPIQTPYPLFSQFAVCTLQGSYPTETGVSQNPRLGLFSLTNFLRLSSRRIGRSPPLRQFTGVLFSTHRFECGYFHPCIGTPYTEETGGRSGSQSTGVTVETLPTGVYRPKMRGNTVDRNRRGGRKQERGESGTRVYVCAHVCV